MATLVRAARKLPGPRVARVSPTLSSAGGRRFFYGESATSQNPQYLENIYLRWKANPAYVDPKWDAYFRSVESDAVAAPTMSLTPAASGASDVALTVKQMISSFQRRGHEVADLDPLQLNQWRAEHSIEELDPAYHGISQADLSKPLASLGRLPGNNVGFRTFQDMDGSVEDLLKALRATYCGSLGIEFMHITDTNKRNWIRSRVESPSFRTYDTARALKVFERHCYANTFETFCGEKFKLVKRFGVDGAESLVPGLKALLDRVVELGCEEFVLGMPHRGRLNVLGGVMKKPMAQIFAEFLGKGADTAQIAAQLEMEDWGTAGDVKYHLGTSNMKTYPNGRSIRLTMEANPSHLETVNPITLGRCRAKQYALGNDDKAKQRVVPVLLHGDASFAGQGVNYETMQLAGVDDFDVGGTVHVVVNNQVGFTTDPKNSRSTTYCTDLAKAFNAPILHCNADDPLTVVRAFELAAEWRQEWGEDVVIDLIGYRRYGHNETDNPDFTQPLLYKAIGTHPRSEDLLARRLIAEGHMNQEEADAIRKRVWDKYEADFNSAGNWMPASDEDSWLATNWGGFLNPAQATKNQPTGFDAEKLRQIGLSISKAPEGVSLHRVYARKFKTRIGQLQSGTEIDWETAEALAFGSILLEGKPVRVTGQDVQRGTFAARNAVVIDQENGSEYCFLNNLGMGSQAQITVRNSVLSEYGVLGFELGYSYENPHQLNIWEAQFGDFANTAQVIFDQYMSAGEHKWLAQSGLVVNLPHGYEAQGAEHSSGRLERCLQMCDDDEDDVPDFEECRTGRQVQKCNWQIVNMTTPANYFHALRQQLCREFRKPLINMSPKKFVRSPLLRSNLEDFGEGTSFQRVIGERDPEISNNPDGVDRLVLCTGKVYFELLQAREKAGLKNVAIVTLEMIAPFPFDLVLDEIMKYKNVSKGDGVRPGNILWVQEEPKNMGAWAYVRPRIAAVAREGADIDLVTCFVGRRASAAPATGLEAMHNMEHEALMAEALYGHEGSAPRPSALLGHQT